MNASRKPATYPKVMIWPGDKVVAMFPFFRPGGFLYDSVPEGTLGTVVSVVWLRHSVSYVTDFRINGRTVRHSCEPTNIGLVLEDDQDHHLHPRRKSSPASQK